LRAGSSVSVFDGARKYQIAVNEMKQATLFDSNAFWASKNFRIQAPPSVADTVFPDMMDTVWATAGPPDYRN